MNKKNAPNAGAVIEIGSSSVRMRVSQISKGKIRPLDYLEYPVSLGQDVYRSGSVSFESLRELSSALGKFSSALLSYHIENPKVVTCATLLEAKNRALVVDQLKVRNGMDVEILGSSQEKAYIFSEIQHRLAEEDSVKDGYSLAAYIGSGSIGFEVFDGEKAIYFQNLSAGTRKLYDVLGELRRQAEDFHCILEEYMDALLSRMSLPGVPLKNLIITGSRIGQIAKLCGAKKVGPVFHIEAQKLAELYDSLRSMTAGAIAARYGIPERQAALLYTAIFIYRGIMRFCPEAPEILAPPVDIAESVARYMLTPKAEAEWSAYLRLNALSCAKTSAQAFRCEKDHSGTVAAYAGKLFDRMKKLHGLDPSKRLILELAAALHSCGSFVSARQHNRCTFDIIRGMDLFGLSSAEILEVALVAGGAGLDLEAETAGLPQAERITISKLSAIFRLANAMDKSHQRKLKNIKMSLDEDRVLIRAESAKNTLLEHWAFEEAAKYFKDVFGLSPELAVKFDMI